MSRRLTDTHISVALDRDEQADLIAYAKTQGLTASGLFRLAVNEYLTRHNIEVAQLEVRLRGRPVKKS